MCILLHGAFTIGHLFHMLRYSHWSKYGYSTTLHIVRQDIGGSGDKKVQKGTLVFLLRWKYWNLLGHMASFWLCNWTIFLLLFLSLVEKSPNSRAPYNWKNLLLLLSKLKQALLSMISIYNLVVSKLKCGFRCMTRSITEPLKFCSCLLQRVGTTGGSVMNACKKLL